MPAMDYSKVAHLYDVYVKTDLDLPFFLREAEGCGSVLELMSGTGRLSIPLIEAGVPLTCVDSAPEMLTVLKQKLGEKNLSAPVHEMDVCSLSLKERFDLIILPFNSFSEILKPEDQRSALSSIRNHLVDGGRFICTLHNPPVRLKSVDGRARLLGKHPMPDSSGTLFFWIVEQSEGPIVRGTQFYEIYDRKGEMCSRSFLDLSYCLHGKEEFEVLVQSKGFRPVELFGDYSRSPFEGESSPFMIWILETA